MHRKHKSYIIVLLLSGIFLVTVFRFHVLENHENVSGRSQCADDTNIVFLKIHKTGSSTIANILQRFGHERHLTFALPNKTHGLRVNYIGDVGDTISRERLVYILPNETYNILYNHVIFNEQTFKEVFPGNAYYFTLVREPLQQFLSSVNYYSGWDYIHEILSLKNPMSYFLDKPYKYEPENIYLSYTNNRQSLDLGIQRQKIRDQAYLQKYFLSLNKRFNLVMIFEYFDESLILLKRQLCWSIRDILYMRKNIYPKTVHLNVSASDLDRFKNWALADNILYEMFYKEFWKKVFSEENDFFGEVRYFRWLLKKVHNFCNSFTARTMVVLESRWNSGFTIANSDCTLMKMDELQFMGRIFHDQVGQTIKWIQ